MLPSEENCAESAHLLRCYCDNTFDFTVSALTKQHLVYLLNSNPEVEKNEAVFKREALPDNGVMSVVNDILMSRVLLWRIRKEKILKHSLNS